MNYREDTLLETWTDPRFRSYHISYGNVVSSYSDVSDPKSRNA
jgi:hypothetical protein